MRAKTGDVGMKNCWTNIEYYTAPLHAAWDKKY